MGVFRGIFSVRPARPLTAAGFMALAALAAGCQTGLAPATHHEFKIHAAQVQFTGLKAPARVGDVSATLAAPEKWTTSAPRKTRLYTHQQWRSPSTHTGIGIVYVNLPLPLSSKTIVWLAQKEYSKKSDDGRLLGQWTDELGREWFEAENNKYHARGYAIAKGFHAWVVYFGYRTHFAPDPGEISLAGRSVESIVPDLGGHVEPAEDSQHESK